jgi:iron complex transport system substrate-binding protein
LDAKIKMKFLAETRTVKTKFTTKGFEIYSYKGYSIVKSPPGAKENFTTFYKKKRNYSDSIKQFTTIQIPIKSIVTSTTHVPALEMLGVENTLVGFPNTDYISSEKHENALMQER